MNIDESKASSATAQTLGIKWTGPSQLPLSLGLRTRRGERHSLQIVRAGLEQTARAGTS